MFVVAEEFDVEVVSSSDPTSKPSFALDNFAFQPNGLAVHYLLLKGVF